MSSWGFSAGHVLLRQPRRVAHEAARDTPGALTRALGAVASDAALDDVPTPIALATGLLPAAGSVLLALPYLAARHWYYWLLREDHVIEWSQFAFLLTAALFAAVAAARLTRRRRLLLATLLVLVAVVGLGMAGEEISWGQRVFGWATPHTLAAANAQGETSLHNLDNGLPIAADLLSVLVELLMGAGGLVLGLLTRPARSALHRSSWWSVSPPLFCLPGFALMSLYQLGMLAGGTQEPPAVMYQEWAEFCFYLSIAVTVGCVCARVAADRYLPAVQADGRRSQRRLDPASRIGRRPLIVSVAIAVVITLVFAVLTARTGILPGNVPHSLA
jgi:hypothetical protein